MTYSPTVAAVQALTQASRTNHMTVVEIWADRKAMEAHSTASHMKQYREKLLPMSGSLYDERLYRALRGESLPGGEITRRINDEIDPARVLREVAAKYGIDISMVSRIRSGQRRAGRMGMHFFIRGRIGWQKVVAVAHRLHQYKGAVQHQRHHRHKGQLAGAVHGARRARP